MTFPHVTPGTPWRPNAAKENAWTDAANDFLARRSSIRPGLAEASQGSPVVVWAKNVSASSLDQFAVVGLRDPIFADSTKPGFKSTVGFEVSSPADSVSPFAILQEPIRAPIDVESVTQYPSKRVAMIVGVSPVQILVNDSTHGYAVPVAGETGYLESAEFGPAVILWKEGESGTVWALVRLVVDDGADLVPGILRIVTNNCLNDKPAVPAVFRVSEDTVVDDHGQTLIDSTILAGKGAVTFKASVTWTDPDWAAYTNDHFEFRLIMDGNLQTEVCEHIVSLGGPAAKTVKEFTWHYTNPTKRPIPFLLYAIRTSGFGDLTATTDSKVEVSTLSATNRVEYRQLILPKGVKVGPKICVDDPKDCCVDDQSSISSSAYLNIPCCPVPVPSQWKVTFSNVTLSQYGDEILYLVGNASTQRVNWSPLSLKVQNALNATHVLNYVGFEQKTIGGQTYVDCIFEKILSITDPYYETVFDGVRSSVHITNWAQYSADVQPRITFKIRHLVNTNNLFYNYLIPPTGPVDAPQVAAMATLECHFAYLGPYASGILTSSGTGYYRQYVPHFTGAYHTTQDWPNAQYLEYANTAADFPDPGTSCDGPCKLWSLAEIPGSIHANNGEHPNGAIFPLFNTVEPV